MHFVCNVHSLGNLGLLLGSGGIFWALLILVRLWIKLELVGFRAFLGVGGGALVVNHTLVFSCDDIRVNKVVFLGIIYLAFSYLIFCLLS